jgi:hypothetical protein
MHHLLKLSLAAIAAGSFILATHAEAQPRHEERRVVIVHPHHHYVPHHHRAVIIERR